MQTCSVSAMAPTIQAPYFVHRSSSCDESFTPLLRTTADKCGTTCHVHQTTLSAAAMGHSIPSPFRGIQVQRVETATKLNEGGFRFHTALTFLYITQPIAIYSLVKRVNAVTENGTKICRTCTYSGKAELTVRIDANDGEPIHC